MKTLKHSDNSILLETEKKKLFSSDIVKKTTEIFLNDIEHVNKEVFSGKFNSITILKKDGTEEFFALEDFSNLEDIYQFLFEQRNAGRNYKISLFDIETGEEKEL